MGLSFYVTLLKKYSCNFFQFAIWKGSFWSNQIINHKLRFLASCEDQDGKNWIALKYFSLSYRNDWGRLCRHLQKVSWRQWRTSCFKIATTVQKIIIVLNQIYYFLMGSSFTVPFKNQVQLQSFPAWHFRALLFLLNLIKTWNIDEYFLPHRTKMTKKLSATEIFSLSYRNDWGSVSPSPESVLTPVEDTSHLKLPQLCAKISTVSNLFFADGFKCIMWVREKIVFFSWRLTSDGSYFHVAPAFCLSPHYLQFWIVFIWICSSSSWAPPPNLNATLPLFRSIPCRFFRRRRRWW